MTEEKKGGSRAEKYRVHPAVACCIAENGRKKNMREREREKSFDASYKRRPRARKSPLFSVYTHFGEISKA